MKLENRCVVPADRDTTWSLVMDLPRVAPCVPGLSKLEAEGDDRYTGTLLAQAGPMRVNLSGTLKVVSRDDQRGEAHFLLEAADRRIGGSVKTTMTPAAIPHGRRPDRTDHSHRHRLYGRPGHPGPAHNPPQSCRYRRGVCQEPGGVGGEREINLFRYLK